MKFKNFYAVVGFDGSGKSTVIATLTKLETNSASFHFIPKSYKERLGGDKKNLIHKKDKISIIMSFIRIIKNLIICWIKIPLILYKKTLFLQIDIFMVTF